MSQTEHQIFSPKPASLFPKPASLLNLLFSVWSPFPLVLLSSLLSYRIVITSSFRVSPGSITFAPSPRPLYYLIICIRDIYKVPLTGLYVVSKTLSTVQTSTLKVVVSHSHDYWTYLDTHYSRRAVWVYVSLVHH